jgi:hypothetical protein
MFNVEPVKKRAITGLRAQLLKYYSANLKLFFLCFLNGENPVLMSTLVSSLNVDGTRPTVGVSVLQAIVTPGQN